MRPIGLTSLVLVLSSWSPVLAYDRVTGRAFASRSQVIARHAMVATSQPLATQIALDILKRGGSAVDAAIAANAALGLMEPTGSGVGGDLFAIVWDAKTKKLYGLNASGRSPKNLTMAELHRRGLTHMPPRGPLPVTVPGCVDGWFELHRRFGKLPMKSVLGPAIRYAEEGFPVSELVAHYWNLSVPLLEQYAGFKETFMPGGRAPAKGEIFKNPRLAATYRALAGQGREVFYRGRIARAIAAHVKAQGGFLSYQDLAAHRSEWVDPVSTTYRGVRVWELPPNGQGIAVLQMLNILERYDLAKLGFASPEYLHLLIEAKKLAFEDRARFYADPAFSRVPLDALISKAYARRRAKRIDPSRAAVQVPAGDPLPEAGDTVYLTVADADGNMVSLIQSNYRGMGSGITPAGLGFSLQDRGELFDLSPGRPNSYAPGKRPFHTIIPGFVTREKKPWMSFGVMGGAMQPQGQVQIIVNLVDFGMNLQEAGDAPRVCHSGSSQPTGEVMTDGGRVHLESGFPEATVARLKALGHRIEPDPGVYGGYQAIRYDAAQGVYYGASDARKDGQAAGY